MKPGPKAQPILRGGKKNLKPTFTPKELLFIEYFTTKEANVSAAARYAGYSLANKGLSSLLKLPRIANEIRRRQQIAEQNVNFNINKLLEWSAAAATYDISSIFVPGTFEILPVADWPDKRLKQLCEGVKVVTTTSKDGERRTTMEVKFLSRNPNFDRIAMLMGVPKRFDINVANGQADTRRAIPMAVIDIITERLDVADQKEAREQQDSVTSRKLSIDELDAASQDE